MTVKAKAQITIVCVVDVKATYRYYLLQSSTLVKPSKPTSYPPDSKWDDTEPSYTSGSTNSLYFTDCTVFCDDTYSYSTVSLSSSYEAAKVAYNKAVNAQNTANSAQDDIDNLAIGGKNLIRNSNFKFGTNYWVVKGLTANVESDDEYGSCIKISTTNTTDIGSYRLYTDITKNFNHKENQEYTLSFMAKADSETTMQTSRAASTNKVNYNLTTEWKRFTTSYLCLGTGSLSIYPNDVNVNVYITNIKIEIGNRNTDWTPAPEDTDNDISNLKEYVDNQATTITNDCNGFVVDSLTSYVKIEDNETYKNDLETRFEQTSSSINLIASEINKQATTNDETTDKFSEIYKRFNFTTDGLEIISGNSSLTLSLDNDKISFKKNGVEFGWWDGNDFHTGNIVVEVNERAQFGNFAFVPRSDGSLMFLKVEG